MNKLFYLFSLGAVAVSTGAMTAYGTSKIQNLIQAHEIQILSADGNNSVDIRLKKGTINAQQIVSGHSFESLGSFKAGPIKIDSLGLNDIHSGIKICSYTQGGAWRDSVMVPANWSGIECAAFASNFAGANSHQLVCITATDYKVAPNNALTWPAPCVDSE